MRRCFAFAALLVIVADANAAWSVRTERSKMDDSVGVYARTPSLGTFNAWPGGARRAQLLVQCSEGRFSMWLETGASFAVESENDRATLRLRFDKGDARTAGFDLASDGKAAGAPDKVLVECIAQHRRLKIEFVPFNSNPAVVEFDLRGFDKAKAALAAACPGVFP